MANDQLSPLGEGTPAAADVAEDLQLLRRYEPVLRFTRGELFLPMSVENYLATCSLWRAAPRRLPQRLCAPGELTPSHLADVGAASSTPDLSLRFVENPLGRGEYRAWRRDPGRARLASGRSRFAVVGLLGRMIDAFLRLSLWLRGSVPGGTAAAAELSYRARADPQSCPYYGHVTRDRGFLVLQYWFFYAMNDWRSTFGGVNDHEADWEQVTIYLVPVEGPVLRSGPMAPMSCGSGGSRSPRTTRRETICAGATTTRTSAGSITPIPSSTPAPGRIPGPTWPASTWSASNLRRCIACRPLLPARGRSFFRGPGTGRAPGWAFRTSTTSVVTGCRSARAPTALGHRCSSIPKRPGYATFAACGVWIPRIPSAANAPRPVLGMNGTGPSDRVGPTRWGGRAFPRCRPPPRGTAKRSRHGWLPCPSGKWR